MTPKQYILSTLEKLKAPITMEDIGSTPLEDAIYAKVMSKKFRKLKADDLIVDIAKKAIHLAVEERQPITISSLFGGNKLWRFDEAPEVDWAELFSATYFLEWMKGIASVYKYGARFDYYSQDVCIESLNNIPRSETDKYSESFRKMLDFLKPYIPDGVTVTYRRLAEEFNDLSQYDKELQEAKQQLLRENNGKYPEMDEKMKLATQLNVKLKPGQDSDPQWMEKVEWEHQAIFKTPTLLKYLEDPRLIPTCPGKYDGLIVTGSTKRSYAKFWAGVGALQREGDRFAELVLSPKQLETAQFDWEDIEIEGLEGKNFHRIRLLK